VSGLSSQAVNFHRQAMSIVNYRRHFILLLVAAASLFFLVDLMEVVGGLFYFAFIGLLHALALVVALRVTPSLKRSLTFLIVATALSMGVPFTLFVSGMVLDLLKVRNNDASLASGYGVASAAGAFAYWLVIRTFWLPHLPFLSAARSVGLCLVGTLVSLLVLAAAPELGHGLSLFPDLPTYFWWVSFSSSLVYSEWRATPPLCPGQDRGNKI